MKTNQQNMQNMSVRSLCMALFLLFTGLFATSLWANPKQEHVRKKEYTQSFNSKQIDLLQTDNLYGNTTLTYWKKNEINIQVKVEVKAENEKSAEKLLNGIKVDIEQEGNSVKAVTSIEPKDITVSYDEEKNFINIRKRGAQSIKINYFISLPDGMKCELKQKYGDIYLPEQNNGYFELDGKYGNIKAGDFSKPLEVDLKYGNLTLGNLDKAELELKYCGKAVLGNVDQLKLESAYSNIDAGKIRQCDAEVRYGNLSIKGLDEGKVDMKYCNVEIGTLQKQIDSEGAYGSLTINDVSSRFQSIKSDFRYGNLKLWMAKDASFEVLATNMKYGKCKVDGFSVDRVGVSKNGFDSSRESNSEYHLRVNNGKNSKVVFDGHGYSNLSIYAK